MTASRNHRQLNELVSLFPFPLFLLLTRKGMQFYKINRLTFSILEEEKSPRLDDINSLVQLIYGAGDGYNINK